MDRFDEMMCQPHRCRTKCIGEMKLKIYETRCYHIVRECPCCCREHDHRMHECPHCGFRVQEIMEKMVKMKKAKRERFDPPEYWG